MPLIIWKPWFGDMETSYDLGMAHGKEDRSAGLPSRYRTGCLMTTEEYTLYRQGYGEGYRSERGPEEF